MVVVCLCNWPNCATLQAQLKEACENTGQKSALLGIKRFKVPRNEFGATDLPATKKKAPIKRFVEHLGMHPSKVEMFDGPSTNS